MTAFRSNNVPLTQLLTLGSDGPNVNKSIWREMEQKTREVYPGFQGLVDATFTLFTTVLVRAWASMEKTLNNSSLTCKAFPNTQLLAEKTTESCS